MVGSGQEILKIKPKPVDSEENHKDHNTKRMYEDEEEDGGSETLSKKDRQAQEADEKVKSVEKTLD